MLDLYLFQAMIRCTTWNQDDRRMIDHFRARIGRITWYVHAMELLHRGTHFDLLICTAVIKVMIVVSDTHTQKCSMVNFVEGKKLRT